MIKDLLNSELGETVNLPVDVCIVGAGFAGLSAALRLQEKGVTVVILEARDRVGGRVWTDHDTRARWLDLGGQWVGKPQTAVLDLIERTGTGTYPTPYEGAARIRGVDPGETLVDSDLDWNGVPGIEAVEKGMDLLKALLEDLPPEAPWNHPRAEELDRTTFRQWLDANVADPRARRFMEADISYCCAAAENISVLATLATIKQCGGFKELDEDAQETRIVGGAQRLAEHVRDRLLKPNTVIYNQAVSDIAQDENGVRVYASGFQVRAQWVIVTAPPHVAREIRYHPALPDDRRELMDKWPQGTVIKVGMIFEEPFWRNQAVKLNGLSLDYTQYAVETADSSPTPNASSCGTLTAFVYTNKAKELLTKTPEKRREAILSGLVERFGPAILTPIEYHETYWGDEPYTKGCYGAYLEPGATTKFRDLIRTPTGRIHWAGSETSSIWPTFIEGAVQSGYRAAGEILRLRETTAATPE